MASRYANSEGHVLQIARTQPHPCQRAQSATRTFDEAATRTFDEAATRTFDEAAAAGAHDVGLHRSECCVESTRVAAAACYHGMSCTLCLEAAAYDSAGRTRR
eukprot:5560656-Pleurochrysis_carterae.AAC.1